MAAICIAVPRATSLASAPSPSNSTSTPTAGGRSDARRCMYVATGPSKTATRPSSIFSPILTASPATTSPTVESPSGTALSASRSAGFASAAASAICWAVATNSSLLATKSVSQFSSTSAVPEAATSPADAVRSAPRFSALAAPLTRRISMALSKSPSASCSAFLLSIMPALVMSRSFLTSAAVMFAMSVALLVMFRWWTGGATRGPVVGASRHRGGCGSPVRHPAPRWSSGLGLALGRSVGGLGRRRRRLLSRGLSGRDLNSRDLSGWGLSRGLSRGLGHGRVATGRGDRGLVGVALEELTLPLGQRLLGADLGGLAGLHARASDQSVGDGVGDDPGQQPDGADSVVVAGDREVHFVRVTVGVQDADDRDPQLAGLLDREVLLVGAHDPHRRRRTGHVADAAERLVELDLLALHMQQFLLGATAARDVVEVNLVELLETVDPLVHRLEVCEHATEPALVDVRHADAGGLLGDRLLSLLLGAHEHHRAALGDRVLDEGVRAVDVGQRLLQVDDVDAVALSHDEALHLRVPATGLMPEVDAALEELAHGDDGHVRWFLLFSSTCPARGQDGSPQLSQEDGCLLP